MQVFINWADNFLPFLSMLQNDNGIKNLKISKEVHKVLKDYCEKKGIKMYWFLEKMILDTCKEKKDIYGED